jgi:hypothetical protein
MTPVKKSSMFRVFIHSKMDEVGPNNRSLVSAMFHKTTDYNLFDHKRNQYTVTGLGISPIIPSMQYYKRGWKEIRLDIFMVMKIHIVVFWVMTPCNDVVGYQYFSAPIFTVS